MTILVGPWWYSSPPNGDTAVSTLLVGATGVTHSETLCKLSIFNAGTGSTEFVVEDTLVTPMKCNFRGSVAANSNILSVTNLVGSPIDIGDTVTSIPITAFPIAPTITSYLSGDGKLGTAGNYTLSASSLTPISFVAMSIIGVRSILHRGYLIANGQINEIFPQPPLSSASSGISLNLTTNINIKLYINAQGFAQNSL